MKVLISGQILYLYLSIYQAVIPIKGVAKTKNARVRGDITLSSPSVFYLFVGECTEEELPKPLTQLLLLPFMNSRDYSGRIF